MPPAPAIHQFPAHGAIALGVTGNSGGAFYFISLTSDEIHPCHKWAFCPIQEAVIKRVEAFAIKDKRPLIQLTGLVVELGRVLLEAILQTSKT